MEIVAFCNYKLCLLATRHGGDSSQRSQVYVSKLKEKLSLKISPPFISQKHSKENRPNWGEILFVVPKETDKHNTGEVLRKRRRSAVSMLIWFKAAGDKLLMNKFIRQNFGGGLTLKNFISWTLESRFRWNLADSLRNGGSAATLFLV